MENDLVEGKYQNIDNMDIEVENTQCIGIGLGRWGSLEGTKKG